MSVLYVFLGGGLGSVLRWGVGQALDPWGTVVVNIVGSAILAFLAHPGMGLSNPVKLTVCVGLMGGFTTYSTFNVEILKALTEGQHAHALLLVVVTLLGALAAGAAGWALAGWVTG